MTLTPTPSQRHLLPSSTLPLAYFAGAHAGLFLALVILAVRPELPGAFFLHARMAAVVHLVTLAWITGSILGAFYIVAPLALRMPMPVSRGDWIAFGTFWLGVSGIVSHFWMGEYSGMAWSALLVVAVIGWIAARVLRVLPRAPIPWPVTLHVALAFANLIVAGAFGALIGFDRVHGWLHFSPLAAAFAHAHVAAVGWALMMAIGLSYRLIPMILPAPMPTGRGLAASAVLLEAGVLMLAAAWLSGGTWMLPGGVAVLAGVASFARVIARAGKHRLPRPPALPARDWSTWQAHAALLWLAVAILMGLILTTRSPGPGQVSSAWVYGVASLVGFLSQFIVGMQGRLVPLYAYYRAMDARGGRPPERGANALPSERFARWLFGTWAIGVPLLAWGLAGEHPAVISTGAVVLLAGVCIGGAYIGHLLRVARLPTSNAEGNV